MRSFKCRSVSPVATFIALTLTTSAVRGQVVFTELMVNPGGDGILIFVGLAAFCYANFRIATTAPGNGSRS